MTTTMTEKKFYTQEDLLVACSKLPEKELEAVWKQFDLNTLLALMNVEVENRISWKNQMSELLHRELDKYNAVNRLFDMLPVIEHKVYTDEGIAQKNENISSKSACGNQTDVVE